MHGVDPWHDLCSRLGPMRRVFLLACCAVAAACSSTGLFDGTPSTTREVPGAAAPTRTPPPPPAPIPPPPRAVTAPLVVDLGSVTPETDVPLDVPKNALGFVVIVTGPEGEEVGIEQVLSPTGVTVHSEFIAVGGDQETSASSIWPIATVAVPMSESSAANPPEPGTWKLRFFGPVAGLHAEARIQIGASTGFAGGRLDLDVHLPKGLRLDGRMLSAATAANDSALSLRFDTFYDGLSELFAIDRGAIRFHDASSDLVAIDTEARLRSAFAASGGQPQQQSLSVVLTTAIDLGGGNAAWGVAPGVPGAAITSGTPMSGVILAVGEAPATGDGYALLHEAGHFFGLTHTTELDGAFGDALGDTPRCTVIDVNDPFSVFRCPDVGNLMFPTSDGSGFAESSAAQARVFQGSPVYKAYADASSGGKTKRSGKLTRSQAARPRTRAEAWLSSTICMHSRAHGVPAFRGDASELAAAAADPDLPGALRRRAAGLVSK